MSFFRSEFLLHSSTKLPLPDAILSCVTVDKFLSGFSDVYNNVWFEGNIRCGAKSEISIPQKVARANFVLLHSDMVTFTSRFRICNIIVAIKKVSYVNTILSPFAFICLLRVSDFYPIFIKWFYTRWFHLRLFHSKSGKKCNVDIIHHPLAHWICYLLTYF